MGFIIRNLKDAESEFSFLNAEDFNYGDIVNMSLSGDKEFRGSSLMSLVNENTSISSSFSAVNYYYLRGIFKQDNTVSSGKLKITGPNSNNGVDSNFVKGFVLSGSSKSATGVYWIQFKNESNNPGFFSNIQNDFYKVFRFNKQVFPVFGYNHSISGYLNVLYGYLVGPTNVGDSSFFSQFEFNSGMLEFRTFDTTWAPADNILKDGYFFELKVSRSGEDYSN